MSVMETFVCITSQSEGYWSGGILRMHTCRWCEDEPTRRIYASLITGGQNIV